jgi:hypothetical protein
MNNIKKILTSIIMMLILSTSALAVTDLQINPVEPTTKLLEIGEGIVFKLDPQQSAIFTDYGNSEIKLLALNTIGETFVAIQITGPQESCRKNEECINNAIIYELDKKETKEAFGLIITYDGYDDEDNQAWFSVKKTEDYKYDKTVKLDKKFVAKEGKEILIEETNLVIEFGYFKDKPVLMVHEKGNFKWIEILNLYEGADHIFLGYKIDYLGNTKTNARFIINRR